MPASKHTFIITRFRFFTPMMFAALLIIAVSRPLLAQLTSMQVDSPNIATIRTDVRRVVVDVVVTDVKGRAVTGLMSDDFKVDEDGVPQALRSFDVHTNAPEIEYVAPKIPPLPTNTFLNIATNPESGTPTVILYDALNTAYTRQADSLQELLKFLHHLGPNAKIAIFILTDRLHFAQGFNDSPISGEQALKKALQHFPDPDVANRKKGLQYRDVRVTTTLDALTEIGRFLATLPGRKNLIWYSSGFPENILPGTLMAAAPSFPGQSVVPPIGSGRMQSSNHLEEIRQATDLLRLSRVAVYPIDVRGVTVDSTQSAASNENYAPDNTFRVFIPKLMFINNDTAVRATMDTLADDTGGRASYGTNDLQGGLDRALSNGSNYFSLTYEPTNSNFDGSLRHIKVTLKRSDYNLSYRKLYYADDLAAAALAVADAPRNPLTPSLERGTPLSHGLFIEAHLDAAGAPVPATTAQMQVLSQYEAMQSAKTTKKAKTVPSQIPSVMMQQYYISYGLIARQLDMPADDNGAHQASLELGIISYDQDGRKLNGVDTHIDDTIPAPRYAKLASDGYHVAQSIFVPVTATSIRIAVRDLHANRIGSLEVQLPLAKTAEANPPQTGRPPDTLRTNLSPRSR